MRDITLSCIHYSLENNRNSNLQIATQLTRTNVNRHLFLFSQKNSLLPEVSYRGSQATYEMSIFIKFI